MSFIDIDRATATAIFAAMGEAATYRYAAGGSVDTTAVLEHPSPGTYQLGPSEILSGTRYVLRVLLAEVTTPVSGDRCIVGGMTYFVDQELGRDDAVAWLAVHAGCGSAVLTQIAIEVLASVAEAP